MSSRGLVVLVTDGTDRFPELPGLLEKVGYGVEQCAPFEAVRFAWQRPIDLALLDLSTSNADWPELCQALRTCPNPVKLLAITGYDTPTLDGLPAANRPEAKVADSEAPEVMQEVIDRILGFEVDAEPLADFAALLAGLWQEKATGLLTLQGEVRTAVYFQDGTPVFAELGALSDTLGRILVRQGKLGEDEFAYAIQRMTDSLVENEQIRLGEVLIEMGLLTGEEIYEALRLQTREKLLRCFLWRRLRSDFESGEEHLETIEPFPCEVPSLLLEGIRRHHDQQRVADILEPIRAQRLSLREPAAEVGKTFEIEATGQSLLASLSGEQTVGDVWEGGALDELAAGKILAALVIADAVVLDDELPDAAPAPAPELELESLDQEPAASVSLPAEAPAAAAAPAGGAVLARIKPKKKARPRTQPLAAAPAAVKRKLSTKLERLNAEGAFQQAKRFQNQNALGDALELYKRAAELQPDAVEYAMHAAFVELLLSTNDDAKIGAARRVGRLARAVMAQDESSAEAHAVMGHVRLTEGKNKAAYNLFKKATMLDPNDIASARQVRLMIMRGMVKD